MQPGTGTADAEYVTLGYLALAHLHQARGEHAKARETLATFTELAFIADEPVGYGWMAQQEAEIGELGLHITLPLTERYLWDFATLPAWQGYGLYPRLLQNFLRQQLLPVERVWIIYAPEIDHLVWEWIKPGW